MKYRKRPLVIEATQWFENGDHPEDSCKTITPVLDEKLEAICGPLPREPFLSEGKVVRYYRNPFDDGKRMCGDCGKAMHVHGWIDVPPLGRIVCPGDYIITGGDIGPYPCKPDIFEANHEAAR